MPPTPPRALALLVVCLALNARAAGEVTLPHLDYAPGGKVLDHVKVVPVFWGPDVFHEAQVGLNGFYRATVVSSFFDFLNEYDTVSNGGTQQHISVGTSVDPITITPSNVNGLLSEKDIRTELAAQVTAGHLPTPDDQTLYLVHFPPGVVLSLQGQQDCSTDAQGFCAYHDSGTVNGQVFRYGAMPDVSEGTCFSGCATSSLAAFDVLTLNASHELFEALTDPGPGYAWNDPRADDPVSGHAEIGDICAWIYTDSATITGTGGTNYVVQREWSNRYSGCIVSKDDVFPVTLSDEAPIGIPGKTITLTASIGAPVIAPDQQVQVYVRGVPTGVRIKPTVTPSRLTAGQTATISLAIDAAVKPSKVLLEVLFYGPRATLFRALPLDIQYEDFTVALVTPASSLTPGTTTQVEVNTTNSGHPKTLQLVVNGLPEGVTGTLSADNVKAGEKIVLTLTASKQALATSVGFSLSATSGDLNHTADGTVEVVAAQGCSSAGAGLSWWPVIVAVAMLRRRRTAFP
jgi:hypothetical protein